MTEYICLIGEGEAAPAAGQGQQAQPSMLGMLVPFLLMFFVMYFLVIRPSNKQRREQAEMQAKLDKNDKVVTSSGIIGIVVSIRETEEEVVIKTGDGDPQSRITIHRSTIVRVYPKDASALAEKKS